jgi:hypothetical protein
VIAWNLAKGAVRFVPLVKVWKKKVLIFFDKHPFKEQLSYFLIDLNFHLRDGGFFDIDLDFQPDATFDDGDFLEHDLTM